MPDGVQIPGGPVFIGFPQPADVPCDPTGSGWRGPQGFPGQVGPMGPSGVAGDSVINVLDHGAKGDGTTDDTAAIQSVLNAYAGKATVFVPDTGNPYVVAEISVPSNTDLLIYGTLKLKPLSESPVLNAFSQSNITIRGYGVIDGNASGQTTPTGSGAPCGIAVQNSSNIRISDITIQNSFYWNLNVVGSSNVRVDRVSMLGGNAANEFADGCDNCWLTGCIINGPAGDEGFSFYGGVTNSGATGNIVTNAGSDGFSVLNDGPQPAPCQNIIISDNILHSNFGSGIGVDIGVGGSGAHTGITISGNTVYGNNRSNTALASEVFVDSVNRLVIHNNMVTQTTSVCDYGIYVGGRITDATITGNSVEGIGASGRPGTGIYIQNTNVVLVSGNMLNDFRPTAYMTGIGGTPGLLNVYSGNAFGDLAGTINFTSVQPDTAIYNAVGRTFSCGQALPVNAANDAAAAAAGVPPGGIYRNGSAVQIRVS